MTTQAEMDAYIAKHGWPPDLQRLFDQQPQTLEDWYSVMLRTDGDICKDMPVLRMYAEECYSITELGVRCGVSTVAFLAGGINKLRSYDVNPCPLFHIYDALPKDTDWQFIQADVLTTDVEPADFLFIDTLHTYKQLSAELERHADKALRYIGFHDTVTYGSCGEDGSTPGLLTAILPMRHSGKWDFDLISYRESGLIVLRRKSV